MTASIPTPAIVLDAATVRSNVARMARYAKSKGLALRPHTKTHKLVPLARLQLEAGACGLTVAKSGEAECMAPLTDDLLMAYPPADAARAALLAELGRARTMRVAVDSAHALRLLGAAARDARTTLGVLIDVDVGMGRTGVPDAEAACALARTLAESPGLRFDGIFFYPGHVNGPAGVQAPVLAQIDGKLRGVLDGLRADGFSAAIVSGGSTPTALQSHHVTCMNELRPGTYIFGDRSCVELGCMTVDDCAARVQTTVVSTAVAGQVVIDAGSKALSSDPCAGAPASGFGLLVDYPEARIVKLSEEHGQVDVRACPRPPRLGERITVIPNHICACVNLHTAVWWHEAGRAPERLPVDARGRLI